MKKCCSCKEIKGDESFCKNRGRKDGLNPECRSCVTKRQEDNKEKISEYQAKWQKENKDKKREAARIYRARHREEINAKKRADWARKKVANTPKVPRDKTKERLRQYKLTPEKYEAMLRAQEGCCAICGTTEPRGRGRWHIDHDHACCPGAKTCGKCVRGLLCSFCNYALGFFRDSPDFLLAGVDYLRRYQDRNKKDPRKEWVELFRHEMAV